MVVVCVVFKKVKLSKKEYWKYIIKIVIGFDDYVLMKEVVCCWYSCVIEEGFFLFDFIIIDGGKG